MGQRLADAAVRGTTTSYQLDDEARKLLAAGDTEGLIRFQKARFGGLMDMMAREDDDDDTDDGDDDEDEDDDTDDDEDDEDDDEDDKSKSKSKKPSRTQQLAAEAKKHRLRSVARGRRIKELEAENEKLKKGDTKTKPKGKEQDGDDDAADDRSDEVNELQDKLNKQATLNEDLLIRLEFTDLTTGEDAEFRFKSPKKALRLLDLDDVEITDKGDIEGLKEAIADLAEEMPELLVSKDSDDDEDDEDEDKPKPRRRTTGQRTGSSKRKKGQPNKDKLLAKYPALRR